MSKGNRIHVAPSVRLVGIEGGELSVEAIKPVQLNFNIEFPDGVEFTEPPVFRLAGSREWESYEDSFKPEQAVRFKGVGNVKSIAAVRRANGKWGPVVVIEPIEVELDT